MYARFTDYLESDDIAKKEPIAVFKSDGKIEFVKPDGAPVRHSSRLPDNEGQTGSTPAPTTRVGIKVYFFMIFSVTLIIVIAFTIANFAISVQNLNNLNTEPTVNITGEITKLRNEGDAKLLILSASSKAGMKLLQTDADKKMNELLSNWSRKTTAKIKDELQLTPEVLVGRIETVLTNLSAKVLNNLKDDLDIAPEMIDDRIQTALTNLSEQVLSKLRNEIDELRVPSSVIDERIQTALANLTGKSLARMQGLCKVNYNGQCFWATKTSLSMFYPAVTHCHRHGAEAANIYNEDHYQKILAYLRNFLPPWKTVWLGMTRDLMTGTNYLQNGTISNYTMMWYPNYPRNRTGWTKLGIHVEKDTSASHQGFFNDFPTSKRHGILCEI